MRIHWHLLKMNMLLKNKLTKFDYISDISKYV